MFFWNTVTILSEISEYFQGTLSSLSGPTSSLSTGSESFDIIIDVQY